MRKLVGLGLSAATCVVASSLFGPLVGGALVSLTGLGTLAVLYAPRFIGTKRATG